MTQQNRYRLFQAFGVELEYMIVDRDTLMAKPITDELLKHEIGSYQSDFENGIVTWSNELVLHVVELKSTRPEHDLVALKDAFAENVRRINEILRSWNACLMPTAAHPFMNPAQEAKLWPHENNEVYAIYNQIFDCRGHGWSNLQSAHLNLPFEDDESFAKLHTAIRLLLPILPALCASSPILDGNVTGYADTRMKYYKTNQAKIPAITGRVIPEPVYSEAEYDAVIYQPIRRDIAAYDPDEILDPVWVNSRGAIARFDRGSIEIRVMDVQECPAADLAIVTLVIETLRALANQTLADRALQRAMTTESLAGILDACMDQADEALITDEAYLGAFGVSQKSMTASALWKHILARLRDLDMAALTPWDQELTVFMERGSLSRRMLAMLQGDHSRENIARLYHKLADCLQQNKMLV